MKPINLKLIIISGTIAWATIISQSLFSADISKYRASAAGGGGGGGGGGSAYGPRPGTRAYYREMGRDDSGTPSLASLVEQTAELNQFLAATTNGALFATQKRAERKFTPHDSLVIVVPYKQPDGTITRHLEVPADFFKSYCAIPLARRSDARDFVLEDPDLSVNPYSDKYKFFTTGHHYAAYLPTTINTVDPILVDTLTAQFKATGITAAPPFSNAWLNELRNKYKRAGSMANTKRTIKAIGSPVALPSTQYHRHASPSITTADKPPAHSVVVSTADIIMTEPPTAPIMTTTAHPRRHELATAANAMIRLEEFKKLKPLYERRSHSKTRPIKKS